MARRHGNLSQADLAPGWFAFPSVEHPGEAVGLGKDRVRVS